MNRLILASASPRRKRLLEQINLSFEVAPQNVDESGPGIDDPELLAAATARKKGLKAAESFNDSLIISADTIVILGDDILGKPSGENEAHAMLSRLSGRTHIVITAVCLIRTGKDGEILDRREFSESTRVTFGKLDRREIQDYILTGSPLDKAGAYGIQDDWGSVFVSRIEGDYYNVVGFPLHKFYRNLKSFAPSWLPKAGS